MSKTKSPQHQQATNLQQNWNLLNEKLNSLREQHMVETRAEEKFRLEQLITKTENEHNQIEQELQALENQSLQDKPELSLPIWNIPYRQNPYFTGRKTLLEILHKELSTEHATTLSQPQAIIGLGGIGKTQTALEYAYRHWKDYRIIWWLRAEEPKTLAADYTKLAIKLDLPERQTTEQATQILAVRNWLEQHTGWLLIFDNVVERHDIRHYLPQMNNGHVLITSRNPIWDDVGITLPMNVMYPEEAYAFLAKRTNNPDPQTAITLAKTLGYLPLALEQTAAYIRETGSSLDHYQILFQKHYAQLLQHSPLTAEYPDTVATTWELSFQKVQKTSLAAADFLNLCAFFAPNAISLDMITEGATYVPKRLAKTITDLLTLDQLISILLHYSLLQREGNTLTLHCLVQSVLRNRLNSVTQRRWAERTIQIVNQAFPESEFSNWDRCEQLLPHAQICVKWIEKWEFTSKEAGRLLSEMGSYLHDQAAYTKAEPLFQQALAIREKVLGPEHPDLATTLNNLGLLYIDQGRYTEAEPLLQRALTIGEKVLGSGHLDLAITLDNLTQLYAAQGRYVDAEPLYQQALAIKEKTLGPDHPSLAITLNNLGHLHYNQSRYTEAEPPYQRALTIYKKTLGLEHPDVATSLNNLAKLYADQNRYAEAEPLYQQALTIIEKALGPDHPKLATTLENYASLLHEIEQDTEATTLETRAQAIRTQHAEKNPTA